MLLDNNVSRSVIIIIELTCHEYRAEERNYGAQIPETEPYVCVYLYMKYITTIST